MARTYSFYMIEAAKAVENIVHNCEQLPSPINEAQARPLTHLSPEQQIEAWKIAVETAPENWLVTG